MCHSVSYKIVCLPIMNEINIALSWGETKAPTLLVLSATFDSIDHCSLACLFTMFGVSATAIKWVSSYLLDQLQCVKICYTISF